MPLIPAHHPAAYVFTSGSSGTPLPHRKDWGDLVACAHAEARQLGLQPRRRFTLIGTVPPQHMYGFESTLLLALHNGIAFGAAHPFYPADIAGALEAVPGPRILVTTPIHLRALLESGITLPRLDLLLSATAALPRDLASLAEARMGAPLQEIYGSTETGQIASRRSAQSDRWTLFPGVRLQVGEGTAVAHGGHVSQPTPLHDVIESIDAEHFLLHGRMADLVNIAGKRNSLDYLNHQLNAIPGVVDGAFFLPSEAGARDVTRLMAFVVAPTLDAAAIRAALRERVDPVFLPRPLLHVESLPRNRTGKLPRAALQALAARLMGSAAEAVDDAA